MFAYRSACPSSVVQSKDFITMNKPLLFTVPAHHSALREERNLTGILAKLHFFIKSSLARSIPDVDPQDSYTVWKE